MSCHRTLRRKPVQDENAAHSTALLNMRRKIARLQAPLTLTILCAPARNPGKLLGSKPEGGIMEIGRRQGAQSTGSRQRLLRIAAIVALLAAFAGGVRTLATVGGGPDWGMIGNDATNTRNQPNE